MAKRIFDTDIIRPTQVTNPLKKIAYRVLYLTTLAGPDLLLATIIATILFVTVISVGGHIKFMQASLALPIVIMLLLILYKTVIYKMHKTQKPDILSILRDWLPFLFIAFMYENLHDLTNHFYHYDFAELFMNWDIAIFGVEPTLWAQKIHSPLMTDLMAISYALYFAFPLFLMFILSKNNRRFQFREVILAVTFAFILGFIGYIMWPTSPPRFFITEQFTNPVHLQGFFVFQLFQSGWDACLSTGYGAFPSLHVGISSLSLLYAWKFRKINTFHKWTFYIYTPLVVSLWISTVYLRHHWVIDIFAGWAVGMIAFLLSENILKFWKLLNKKFSLQ